ncbi:hypothetical protein OKA05_10730 [Luteolibacter arcticus]|uniref:Tetratricopeptide repeat protein n=1 Tax=Luteolibacter arcticus TaxID=1581411 RepID=A0ABT3GHQ0_9BACT|nr:hypothetical protein [Luteolibacter arcticus]MCW1923028.1 hypothetical protein [Luteolibacter arcticus]
MNPTTANEKDLKEALKENPADWDTRKRLAHLLYDQERFTDAANLVWATDEIPNIDLELAFAARVLAKAAPRKAIRLLTALLELNQGKAVQNLGLANALLHHGMVLQAARFYGAAMEADPELGNADLEHFMLWTDDEETLWGNFKNRRPRLGELPWMRRSLEESMKLTASISRHTTPIRVASLEPALGEELSNELYEQTPAKRAQPSPPPAVTIPMDRVNPKDRLFDPDLGAPSEPEPAKKRARPAAKKAAKVPEKASAVPKPSATPTTPQPDLPSTPTAPPAGPRKPDMPAAAPAAGPRRPDMPAAPAGAPRRPDLPSTSTAPASAPAAAPRKPELPPLAAPTVGGNMPVPPPSLPGGGKAPARTASPDLPGLTKLKLTPSHPSKLKMPPKSEDEG